VTTPAAEADLGYVTRIPVTFVLARVSSQNPGRWDAGEWVLESLVVAGLPGKPSREPGLVDKVTDPLVEERWIWKGFSVGLFKDAGESYWYNLQSEKPNIFIICEVVDAEDEDGFEEGELRPMLVTCSQDEAMSHIETDDLVLSWPMPPEVAVNVERFVVATYDPVIKKKRRRRNWSDEPGKESGGNSQSDGPGRVPGPGRQTR